MELLQQISESLQRGDREQVAEFTRQAIDADISATQILNDGLMTGMNVVGQRFGAHEIFLPELLISARAMNAGIDLLKPQGESMPCIACFPCAKPSAHEPRCAGTCRLRKRKRFEARVS